MGEQIEFRDCRTKGCQNTEHVDFDEDGEYHYGYCAPCLEHQVEKWQERREWEYFHND